MNHQEYVSWLKERHDHTKNAIEVAAHLGLAGELKIATIEQLDVNDIATQQLDLIEAELTQVTHEKQTSDFIERHSEFVQRLDSVKSDLG